MKIKLDENLPSDWLPFTETCHDIDTVESEGLRGADDRRVWLAAQAEDRMLFTQDMDFSDLRKFLPGTHAGIVLLRLQNPSRRALMRKILEALADPSFESWRGCFVIVTESKTRVRRAVT